MGLDGQTINIYHYVNGARFNDDTVTTYYDSTHGHGFFTSKEIKFTYTGTRSFYAEFAGSGVYLPSKAGPLQVIVL